MGEGYRGEDTKLHRQPARKVLPDIGGGDPKWLARSLRCDVNAVQPASYFANLYCSRDFYKSNPT